MSSKEENDVENDQIEQDETKEQSKKTHKEKRTIEAVHLYAAYATYFTMQDTTKLLTSYHNNNRENVNETDKKIGKKTFNKISSTL